MSATPIVVCIDVEPDHRRVDDERRPWLGFERLAEWAAGARERLKAQTGAPARFTWFVRLDAQIADVYGTPAWPLRYYARQFDALRAAGDGFGVHVHAYRRDATGASWMVDDGSQPWVEQSVRDALQTFAGESGSRCRLFRFGDHWMNDATVRYLEAQGVEIDLTLEPGITAASVLVETEVHSGSSPDLSRVPRVPYRPSRADYRVADPQRTEGLWMMPVTTGRLPGPLASARRLRRWTARSRDESFDVMTLNLNLRSFIFRQVAARLLRATPHPPCLVVPVRSDVGARPDAMARVDVNLSWLASRPRPLRPEFCPPAEALAATTGG